MSSLPAVFSTRKVKTCPAFRSVFSSDESSFRMTLFSVTTGDFRMSQTVKLLIVGRLLLYSFRLCFFRRLSLFSFLSFRLFLDFCFNPVVLCTRIEKLIQLFDRDFRDQNLF